MNKLLTVAQTNNLRGWIDDLEKQVDALQNAKTQADKISAAQGIVSSISNLGR